MMVTMMTIDDVDMIIHPSVGGVNELFSAVTMNNFIWCHTHCHC